MKKKLLVILLACAMLVSLVACKDDSATEESSTDAATEEVEEATETPVETEKAFVNEWALPYEGDEVTISMLGWEGYEDFNDKDNMLCNWIKDQLGNINLEIEIPADSTSIKIEMYMASGDMPDLMLIREPVSFMNDYGDGSRSLNLLDYADYMPEYTARRVEYPHLSLYDSEDGKCYLFTSCYYDAPSIVWFQNQDLMDKYSLGTPTTPDEMLACMQTVCEGEGDDMLGMAVIPWGMNFATYLVSSMYGSEGQYPTSVYYDYDAGEWKYSFYEFTDAYKAAAEFLHTCYEEGYLHPDFISQEWESFVSQYSSGNALYLSHYIGAAGDYVTNGINANVIVSPAAEGITPFAETAYQSDSTSWFFCLDKDTEYPELCCSILDLFGSEDFTVTCKWGWQDETYGIDAEGSRYYLDSYTELSADEKEATYGLDAEGFVSVLESTFYSVDSRSSNLSYIDLDGWALISNGLNDGTIETYISARTPDIDEYDTEDVSLIETAMETYIVENLSKFVLGEKDMSEWESFVEGLSDVGDISQVLEIYNNAEQKTLRAQQEARTYVIP